MSDASGGESDRTDAAGRRGEGGDAVDTRPGGGAADVIRVTRRAAGDGDGPSAEGTRWSGPGGSADGVTTDSGDGSDGRRGPKSDEGVDGVGADRADAAGGLDDPRILLFHADDRNRRLLAAFLEREATVTATMDPEALAGEFDLCVVDRERLRRHREAVGAWQDAGDPTFRPVVLVTSEARSVAPATWQFVDEVVETPVDKATLRARLQNLLARRRQSRRLAAREADLDAAVSELRVRDRAMAEAPTGVTIAGPREADTPLVYVNDAFLSLTGYDRGEVLGRNCRFLQGERTDEAAVAEIRAAIDAGEPVSVDLVNYTRDGERFWNQLDVSPVRNDDGEVTHFVGFQTDITARKLHEQRVTVLNRFMRHNLRNELNVIDGYREALASGGPVDGETALSKIGESVTRLVELSEEVSHVERVFSSRSVSSRGDRRTVASVVESIGDELGTRHPAVPVHVETPDGRTFVNAESLALGCTDYLSMLLDNNDRPDPRLSVVATRDGGQVDIALSDNGDGLPDPEWAVLEAGIETPLHHSDRLGLWVLQWATTTNGGELIRADDGTLHVRCPVRDPPTAAGEGDGDGDEDGEDGGDGADEAGTGGADEAGTADGSAVDDPGGDADGQDAPGPAA